MSGRCHRLCMGVVMLVVGVTSLLPGVARAGETLSVRLVEAHNESAGVDAGLRDVEGTLRGNLPDTGFTLDPGRFHFRARPPVNSARRAVT